MILGNDETNSRWMMCCLAVACSARAVPKTSTVCCSPRSNMERHRLHSNSQLAWTDFGQMKNFSQCLASGAEVRTDAMAVSRASSQGPPLPQTGQ